MDIKQFFFKYRGFTPVPVILIVIIFAEPSVTSFLWGISLMVIGEIVRISGVSYAGGATRTRNVGAPQLVTNGPFGYVRNPLYIGNILMYSGAAVIANVWLPWLIFAVLIFFGIQYHLIVKLEEEKLENLFGQAYLDYKKQVPRFIPQFPAYASAQPVAPDYSGALKSEKSTFISFAAILILLAGKMILF